MQTGQVIENFRLVLENPPNNSNSIARRTRCNVYILSDILLTPELCERHRGKVFVFADNSERWGKAGQAIIRDCPNSFGIRTKVSPRVYVTDQMFEKYCSWVKDDLETLLQMNHFRDVVLHASGYGNGLADMPKRAPKCYEYLNLALNKFCGGNYFDIHATS